MEKDVNVQFSTVLDVLGSAEQTPHKHYPQWLRSHAGQPQKRIEGFNSLS